MLCDDTDIPLREPPPPPPPPCILRAQGTSPAGGGQRWWSACGGRRPAASVWWLHQPSLVTCCIVVTLLAQCGASATPNHWPCCPKARRRDLCASWGGTCLLVGVGFGLAIGMVAWHAWWGGVHARDAGGRRRPAGERHGMEGSVSPT
jgi:hypothetical protein